MRMVLRAFTAGVLGLAVTVAVTAPAAQAQVRLIPQIGVYSAVEDPGRVQGASGLYEIGKYESTFAYGGALEFAAGRGLGIRLGALYASEAETVVSGFGCQTGCPAGVDLLSVNGAFVIRPLRLPLVQPYLSAGGGLKRFDFEPEDLGDGVGQVFSDESEWAGVLGLGAEVGLGLARVAVEVTDHFHWSDREIPGAERDRRDDFFFTVGLVLGGW